MRNRQLTPEELSKAQSLLKDIRTKLEELSGNDLHLYFAYRRKIYKELTYDERGKPAYRKQLKESKRKEQNNRCPICHKNLPQTYTVLDRFEAALGYTESNTQLIHQSCDISIQKKANYS